MTARCIICDRPAGDSRDEHWQGNRTVCERLYLQLCGLRSDGADKECRERAVNWRARYEVAEETIADLREQLKAARASLSRRHASQYPATFRSNARIE